MNQRQKNNYWVLAEFWAMLERQQIKLNYAARLLGVDRSFLYQLRRGKSKLSSRIADKMGFLLYIEKQDASRLGG